MVVLSMLLTNICERSGVFSVALSHGVIVLDSRQVLRLLHHLVKFGYYMDLDDVRKLLPPLLSLLDGRHDVPFPKDKSKGREKHS